MVSTSCCDVPRVISMGSTTGGGVWVGATGAVASEAMVAAFPECLSLAKK
jgi:hypothetical protein